MLDNNTGLMWVKDLKTVPVIGSQLVLLLEILLQPHIKNAITTIAEMNKMAIVDIMIGACLQLMKYPA